MASNATFSSPLPAKCFGIEKATGDCTEVLGDGLPAIAAGQAYIFDGGQNGGLTSRIGKKLELEITYLQESNWSHQKAERTVCVKRFSPRKCLLVPALNKRL